MTRADYLTKVQNEVDDTSTASANVIKEAITEIYDELMEEIKPFITGEASEEISVTSATCTPTNSYEQISSVYYKESSTWTKLERVSEVEFATHLNDTQTTPEVYVVRGNTVVLNGVPTSGTLRVQGVVEITRLSTDVATSSLPDRYTRVLVLGAVYRFLGYEKDPASENYKAWYEQAKAQMLARLAAKAPTINPQLY